MSRYACVAPALTSGCHAHSGSRCCFAVHAGLSRCSRYTCSRSAWCTPTRSGTPPIHASHPAASDGEYTISPSGNTFTIYCHNMANQPTEYLTLVHTESAPISGGSRSAGLRLGLTLSPASQRSNSTPATLQVDTTDLTFATSTGEAIQVVGNGNNDWKYVDFGRAGSCVTRTTPPVRASSTCAAPLFKSMIRRRHRILRFRRWLGHRSVRRPPGYDLRGGGYCG